MQQRASRPSTGERGPAGIGGHAYHALSAALLSALATGAHAGGTRIEADGRTATDIATEGERTRITTDTVRGEHAFNSFGHFRVGKGHEANLQLPDGTRSLINLVHDSRAVIDGTVNSLRDGAIGGQVIFADPHGFLVGAAGTLNVGSLGVATPSAAFMDRVIDPAGRIDDGAVDDLLRGDFDLAPGAEIRIDGTVNAEDGVRLVAGDITVGGDIDVADAADSDSGAEAVFESAVNVDGLARAERIAADDAGVVIAAAGDAAIDGRIEADGRPAGGDGGTVIVTADDTATLGGDAEVDVSGAGADAGGGTVAVWGSAAAVAEAGAVIDADAGTSGDGGLVEVSAGERVTLRSAEMHARAGAQGAAGEVVIDPAELTISGRNDFDGTAATFEADESITVAADAVINTRETDQGIDDGNDRDDPALAASTGDSGRITLDAPSITLAGDGASGARLLTFATGGFAAGDVILTAGDEAQFDGEIDVTPRAAIDVQAGATIDAGTPDSGPAGDVTLSATAIDRQWSGFAEAVADIDIDGEVTGRDITAEAVAKSLIRMPGIDPEDVPAYLENPEDIADHAGAELATQFEAGFDDATDLSSLGYALPVEFAVADADATVDVGASSDITAARDLTLDAAATRESTTAASGIGPIGLAGVFGQVSGTTRAEAAAGATVAAGRNVGIDASSTNTLVTAADAVGPNGKTTGLTGAGDSSYKGLAKIGGALAIGHVDTTTTARLAADPGSVTGDVLVTARDRNTFSVDAFYSTTNRTAVGGLTGAVGVFNTHADAVLAGDADAAGHVRVTADSVTEGNRIAAVNAVKSRTTFADRMLQEASAGAARAIGETLGGFTGQINKLAGGQSTSRIQLGGAAALGLTDVGAEARIADGTNASADGHVAVQARTRETGIRTIARNALKMKGEGRNGLVELSTAVTVSRHDLDARAFIGHDATVTGDTVGVGADSSAPITLISGDLGLDPDGWDSSADAIADIRDTATAAQGATELGNALFSSFTLARAAAPTTLGIAGTVNHLGIRHDSQAWIGSGADVTATRAAGESASWSARLGPAGETGIAGAGADGAGPGTWQYEAAVDVQAQSHTGVVTGAGALNLLKNAEGSGNTSAAGGVFSWLDLAASTRAGIADNATVDVANHGLRVRAETSDIAVQILPAAGKGASIGVSGVFGLTRIDNDTRALVADSAAITADTVNVDADQALQAYGLAGAVMLAEQAGVGASVFVHDIATDTEAAVGDIGVAADEDGDGEPDNRLPAGLRSGAAFAAGGGTLTTADLDITADTAGRVVGVGVAGAVSRGKSSQKRGVTGTQRSKQDGRSDSATGTTTDRVQNDTDEGDPGAGTTLTQQGDRLRQRSDGDTSREGLSGSERDDDRNQQQQTPKFGLAVSASAAFNRGRNSTDARLAGATVEGPAGGGATDVTVRAVDDTDHVAAAGAAALTLGGKKKSKFSSALAGAAGINWLENDAAATITGASVQGADSVRVRGMTAGDQVAIGLGLAASAGGKKNISVTGSGSLNLMRGSTKARVTDATVTADDADGSDLSVVAYDRTRSLTGGGAFFGAAGQGAGVGAAATLAWIANDIDAGLHSASVTGFDSVGVEALSSSQILLAAVTAGGGTKAGIGGAFYGAYIGNALSARVDDGGDSADEASVTEAGDVTVRATGVDAFADLDARATDSTPAWLGGASALTDNEQLTQEIDPGADTGDTEGLSDSAAAEPMLGGNLTGEMVLGIASGVQGAKELSGTLAFGFSLIDTDYEAVVDGATIEAAGEVDVTAANQATVAGVAFGVAGGGKGAFTGSAVANVVRADVEARIGSDRDPGDETALAADRYRATVDGARVNVGASANGAIYAFSGNVAAAGNNAGGAAIAYNSIGGDVGARIAAADVTTSAVATEARPHALTVDSGRRSAVRALGAAGQFSGSTTIGGTLVVNDLLGSTTATVDDGSDIDTDAVAVRATDGGDELSGLWTLAGNFGASGSNAIGGAFAVNTIARTQTAAIDDSRVLADGEVVVSSEALANIRTLAVAGGASGNIAATGSLTVNTLVGAETARVRGADIAAGELAVTARGGRSIWSLAGSVSASGSTSVGFAGAVNTIAGTRTALVEDATIGGAAGGGARADSVTVAAGGFESSPDGADGSDGSDGSEGAEGSEDSGDPTGTTRIASLALAGSATGSTAVGGALSANTIERSETARLEGTTVRAAELDVTANDGTTDIHGLAGSAAGSGSNAVGAGVGVNTIKSSRVARIIGSELHVGTSVDVKARTRGTIRAAGVAAGASGNTGVGGASTTNVLDATVTAGISRTYSSDAGHHATVAARDDAVIKSLAGQVSGANTAAVGASASVNRIGNSVTAFVEGRATDNAGDPLAYRADDLVVEAASRPTIRTAAMGGAVAGEGAGVFGSLAANIVTTETRAAIRGGARVVALDDVAVEASDRGIVRVLGGTAGFGGRAGVSGTATFSLLQGTTEALVRGADTRVSARGTDPDDDATVAGATLTGGAPDPSQWQDPADFDPTEDLAATQETVNGLAVRATSIRQVGVIGTSVSGTVPRLTGSGSAAGVGNANVVAGTTRAAIEDATINPAAAGAPGPGADVDVGAAGHVFNVGYVFAGSGGGWGALAGALDINVIQRTTTAAIHGADVTAGDAVRVDAASTQSAASFALGATAAGAAVSGSVSLGVIRGSTNARIDGGADVAAGDGGVSVEADTDIDTVTAGGAGSGGATATGASFGVAATEATTRAAVTGADTTLATPGAVRVLADTTTGLSPASTTASIAYSAAVAGSASIGVIGNTTEAIVDRAGIGTASDRVGSLAVEATDTVTVTGIAGALGLSAQDVGVGAGAGVLVVRSATRAEILGADVFSAGDVAVRAVRDADLLLATTTAGAGAAVGLAGSVGVIVIGDGAVTSDSDDFDDPDSELDADGEGTLSEVTAVAAEREVNAPTEHDEPLQTVDEDADESLDQRNGDALDADERDSLNASASYDPAERYDPEEDSETRSADETVARIAQKTYDDSADVASTVDAGGNVTVNAVNDTATRNIAGALGVGGAVGAGVGIGITRVYSEVTAAIDASTVRADGNPFADPDPDAERDADTERTDEGKSRRADAIDVSAVSTDPDDGTAAFVESYVGAAGAFGAGAVNVADARLDTAVGARIRGASLEVDTGDVDLFATDDASAAANAYGAAATGGVALAGVYAGAVRGGTVDAVLDPAGALDAPDGIDVGALGDAATTARGWAAAGGLVSAGSGTVVLARDGVDAAAEIAEGVAIEADDLLVSATARTAVTAEALGISLGTAVAVGVSSATAGADADATAEIGDGVAILADDVTVQANRGVSEDEGPGLVANAVDPEFADGLGCPSRSDVGACAYARGAAGALTGGGAAATADAASGGQTLARLGDAMLNVGGDLAVRAGSGTGQYSEATSNALGIVAKGANVAHTRNTVATRARIAAGATTAADGRSLEDLTVRAASRNSADGVAIAGTGGIVTANAAVADTRDSARVESRFAGGTADNAFRAGDTTIVARHRSAYAADVDSRRASLVGVSGARARHDVAPTVDAVIGARPSAGAAPRLEAGSVGMTAEAIVRNPRAADHDLWSGSGGAIDAAAALADSHIAPATTSRITDGAEIDVVGDWRDDGHRLVVEALNDVQADQRVGLDAAGAISVALAESFVDYDGSAGVTLGNVRIETRGDLILGARTRTDLDARTNAKTYGGAGAARGESRARADVVNTVGIGSGADVKVWGQAKLFAGRNAEGEESDYDLTARTGLWNKTAFPIETSPIADGLLHQANTVTVNGHLKGVLDVELAADDGLQDVVGSGTGKDLYREAGADIGNAFGDIIGAGDVSMDVTYSNTEATDEDLVRVDGRVEAGVHSEQRLAIAEDLSITASDEGIDYTVETRDLVTEIRDRLNWLYDKVATYGGSDPAAEASFRAEIRLLERQLVRLSGGDPDAGDGSSRPARGDSGVDLDDEAIEPLRVLFVEIEPILSSSGSIDVDADGLAGSGDLSAPGDATIVVDNNSPAFLEINGLEIPEEAGGYIRLRNAPVTGNADINALNARGTARFGEVVTNVSGPKPEITVESRFNADLQDVPERVEALNDESVIDPAIYVTGDIRNRRGRVTLKANTGDVRISGTVVADELEIDAGGNLVLSYTDAFRHLGGPPESGSWGETRVAANSLIAGARYLNINGTLQSGIEEWSLTLDEDERERIRDFALDYIKDKSSGFATDPILELSPRDNSEGKPAVYYNAENNRLEMESIAVEGGYMDLSGKIMNTGRGEIWDLDLSEELDGLDLLDIQEARKTDSTITVIAEAFDVNNTGDLIEWRVDYDGAADRFELVTPDIDLVEMPHFNFEDSYRTPYGRINVDPTLGDGEAAFNVRNLVEDADEADIPSAGRIRVLDGYGRIDVTNTTGYDLHVNGVDAGSEVRGILRITDTDEVGGDTATTTVYERVGTDIEVYEENPQYDADGNLVGYERDDLRTLEDTREAEYRPQEFLKYAWLTGRDYSEQRTTIKYTDAALDFFPSGEGETIYEEVTEVGEGERLEDAAYLTGEGYIREGVIDSRADDWEQEYDSRWRSCETSSPGVCWEWRYYYKKVETRGRREIEQTAVPADNPIDIEFIGRDRPEVRILSRDSELTYAGDIVAPGGDVELVAGRIARTGDEASVIRAGDVRLEAREGIESARVAATGQVTATTDSGDIGLTALDHKLRVADIETGNGDVRIDSEQDIVQAAGAVDSADASVIRGDGVTLVSRNGAIGGGDDIRIDSGRDGRGVVNLQAATGIDVLEVDGDLRLDRASASGGDVRIHVERGRLIDANTTQTRDTRAEAELLDVRDRMALLSGRAESAVDRQEDAFAERQAQYHDLYWQARDLRRDETGGYVADDFDPDTYEFAFSEQRRDELRGNGFDDAAIDRMEATREQGVRRMHEEVLDNPSAADYDPDYAYELSEDETERLSAGAVWTEQQLENSIGAGLVKGTSDTTTRIEEANIRAGGALDIDAEAIGAETAGDVVIDVGDGFAGLTDEQRIALAAAEPDDITVEGDTVTVRQREDIDVDIGGAITAVSDSDIFLGGETEMNLENVSGEAIRLKTDGSITTDVALDPVLHGDRVILESGSGSVGERRQRLEIAVDGRLTSRAADGVYLLQGSGPLTLQRIFSGGRVAIQTLSGALEPDDLHLLAGADSGIDIQAADGVTLNIDGDVGSADEPLDIDAAYIDPDSVEGDAWLSATDFVGRTYDLVLRNRFDRSYMDGDLVIDGIGDLTLLGGIQLDGDFTAAADAVTVGDGGELDGRGAFELTADRLSMGTGSAFLGDTVELAIAGNVTAGSIRARGTDAAQTDLRLDAAGWIERAGPDSILTNDEGLTRLRAGQWMGSGADEPIRLDVDRLHADADNGDMFLRSDGDITFRTGEAYRSTASLGHAHIVAGAIDGANLEADRLTVDAGRLVGPWLETGSGFMDLQVAGLMDIDTLTSGDTTTIDAGAVEVATATSAGAFTATTVARNGRDGHQAFSELTAAEAIDLDAAGAVTSSLARSDGASIDIGAASAAIDTGEAATTLAIDTTGAQAHGGLDAGGAMTLTAGGDLDWRRRIAGDATLDASVGGTAVGPEATFADGITLAGAGGYRLGTVRSETGALVTPAGGVGGAVDIETLRTPQGRIDLVAGSAAIADGEAGANIDIVTAGRQDHGRLHATAALRFEAGIDHAGVEAALAGGDGRGAGFVARDLASAENDIHIDAGSAAVERADALAEGAAVRIHTVGRQVHGQVEPDAESRLRGDALVELIAGGSITLREVVAGRDSDDPAEGGDAVLESIDGDIVGQRITASRDIVLRALNGRLDLERLDYGGTHTLEAGRDIIAGIGGDFDSRDGEIRAGRHVEIATLGRAGEPGDILLGGVVAEDGHLILDAAGDLRIAEAAVGGTTTSGGAAAGTFARLTAGGAIVVDKGIEAGTTLDASAAGGDLRVGTRLRSGDQQTLSAAGALVAPQVTSGAGVSADAGSMELGRVTAATDVDLDAVRDIVVFSIDSGGVQAIEAGGAFEFDSLTAGGTLDSRSEGATTGRRATAGGDLRMTAGLDGDTVLQRADLAIERVEAPRADLFAGGDLLIDRVFAGAETNLEGRNYTIDVTHTGAGPLDITATGPGDRLAQSVALSIDSPGGADFGSLYTVEGRATTNAERVWLRDAWIDDRFELTTPKATLLADNRDPATRAYDFQLHEMDRRFEATVDGRSLFTSAYVVRFAGGYRVEVPNFMDTHEMSEQETRGQSASRNGLRRLVMPGALIGRDEEGPDDGGAGTAPGETLRIDDAGDGPVNLDLAELEQRLRAARRDEQRDRAF